MVGTRWYAWVGPSTAGISRPIAPLSSSRRSSCPSAEQPVGVLDVDLAAEEMREDAAVMPGGVVLEPPLVVLEQHLRDAPLLDLLVDGPVLVGHHLACQQRRLAVDREGAAGLVDVGALPHQPRRLVDLRLAPSRHDHDLDSGPVAGLEPARLGQAEAALGVAEQRAALPEQGPVEVGVDAAQPQSGWFTLTIVMFAANAESRRSSRPCWWPHWRRLPDRPLPSTPPRLSSNPTARSSSPAGSSGTKPVPSLA